MWSLLHEYIRGWSQSAEVVSHRLVLDARSDHPCYLQMHCVAQLLLMQRVTQQRLGIKTWASSTEPKVVVREGTTG